MNRAVRDPSTDTPPAGAVLIVDDDESMRLLLAEILRAAGHRVACAGGGEEAIRMLRDQEPQLVILDLLMPGTSGWDVLEFLEDRPHLSTTPVVILTAYGDTDTPPGRPVIHKPVDGDLLCQMVDELLAQDLAAGRGVGEAPKDLLPGPRRLARHPRPARGL
jgi:CheY-like chemotaxis protein